MAGNNVNANDIKQMGAKIPDKIETWQMTEPGKLAIASLFYSESYVSINLALADSELTDDLQFHPCFLDIVGGHQ